MIATVADYRKVTGDAFPDDATVTANLARAQDKVEERTGRKFDLAARTESLPAIDGLAWPSAYPVISVALPAGATVTDDGLAVKIAPTNWLNDPALVPFTSGMTPPQYLVTSTGGYAPGAAPIDLIDVICEVAQRYAIPANTAAVPAGATSISVNGQSVSGGVLGGSSALTPALKNAIRRFNHISQRIGS